MSRLARDVRWQSRIPLADALTAAEAFAAVEGMKVEDHGPGRLVLYQGSKWKMRLLGGWFVSPHAIPKRLILTLERCEVGVAVRMELSEAVGFGILDDLFKQRINQSFDLLQSVLAQRLPPHLDPVG